MQGKIIKGIAGFYYVYAHDQETYACRARGIFRKDGVKPLVGDDVEFEITHVQDREGNLTKLLPRKNALVRPAVANVDQALLWFAVQDPEPNLRILDRFLIMMQRAQIPAVICFNKTDLADEERLSGLKSIYQGSGCTVLGASLAAGMGISEVKSCLAGKTTVIAGPSGAGKSTLTNLLQKEVHMETGDVSQKLKRGRQTTRHSQIVPVDAETFLVDTPGFTSLFLDEMEEDELRGCFPEFAPYEGRCRFLGCRHLSEPDCSVKEAVREKKIPSERYESYVSLMQELAKQRRY